MRKVLSLLAMACLFTPAFADNASVSTNPPAYSGGVNTQSMTPNGGLRVQPMDGAGHDVSTSNPLPVTGSTSSSSLTAVAGAQRNVSMSIATALTVPATATTAVISVNGTNNSSGVCAYWQDDGTSPTGTAGQPLMAGAYISNYKVTGLPIKLIQATGATCTFSASFYK